MKHVRKLLSLFLAIALVLSVFILPVSAAENASICPNCVPNADVVYEGIRYVQQSSYHVMDGSCPNDSYNHPHFVCKAYDVFGCVECSYETTVYLGIVDLCSAT